jgi:uncharacterized protein (DUF1330 family)
MSAAPESHLPQSHLIVKSYSTDARFRAFALAANAESAKAGGLTYLTRRMHEVEALEPGTKTSHLWAAQFPTEAARDAAWAALVESGAAALLEGEDAAQVLGLAAVPVEGFPGTEIPTPASVTPPPNPGPRAYMLIEGTPTDQARVDRYRDIILPMISGRGAYYTVFELGASVKVFAGRWSEFIFAISRWPDMAAAHDFWLSDRYQSVAIPTRTGAGRFSVMLAPGLTG